MPVVEESIHIARPRAVVWDYCEDVGNTPVWNPMFLEQQLIGGTAPAPGVQLRCVTRVVGRRFESVAVFTEVIAGERSSLELDRPMRATGSYLFEDEDDGTRFTWRLDAAPGLGGAFGRLFDGLVVAVASRQLRTSLERLKVILEAAHVTT